MKLKTVNIKGKEYVEVNERLIYFRDNYEGYSLTSEVLEKTETTILIKASVINPEGVVIANGLAEEEKGSTFINKTSYVENCETSAWGRALANFGIGLTTSVASADEVQNAVANQKQWVNEGDKIWNAAIAKKISLSELMKHYAVSKANQKKYQDAVEAV